MMKNARHAGTLVMLLVGSFSLFTVVRPQDTYKKQCLPLPASQPPLELCMVVPPDWSLTQRPLGTGEILDVEICWKEAQRYSQLTRWEGLSPVAMTLVVRHETLAKAAEDSGLELVKGQWVHHLNRGGGESVAEPFTVAGHTGLKVGFNGMVFMKDKYAEEARKNEEDDRYMATDFLCLVSILPDETLEISYPEYVDECLPPFSADEFLASVSLD